MAKIAAEKVREFRAEAKFQRTSPQKAKLVLDTIKGMRVEQALNTVHFSTKRMAPVIEKVLRSAIQNATYVSQEQGLDVDVDNLYVRTAVANEGPAHEAHPPGADGPRVPLPAPAGAHCGHGRGEEVAAGRWQRLRPEAPAAKASQEAGSKKAAAKKAAAKKAPAKKSAAKKAAK